MNIVIKIIDSDKVIEFSKLSNQEKIEYGEKLNNQAMKALGYELVK